MQRYRNAITQATRQSVDERALSADFIKFVTEYTPRAPERLNFSPDTQEMYDSLTTKLYAPLYGDGLVSRGPSFQLFEMFRVVDLGRNGDGTVDWGGITNNIQIKLHYFSSDTDTIVLDNANIENHKETGQQQLIFKDADGTESVSFLRVNSTSGVPCWKVEHILSFNGKQRVMFSVHITEILLGQ